MPLELSSAAASNELVSALWGSAPSHQNLCHLAYRHYYGSQWALAADRDGTFLALKNPTDINELIDKLQSNASREELLAFTRDLATKRLGKEADVTDEQCQFSIDLAARLLLMMRVGFVDGQKSQLRYPRLLWDLPDQSLGTFVTNYFEHDPVLDYSGVKFPKSFNAWSIENIGGIQIGFTENLADHLLLVEDTKVLVFPFTTFLRCQKYQR
jgi:hypothetical protein